MNLEIKTLYVLLYLLTEVTQNNGLVNLNGNNDNPLLLQIIQSLDTATSNKKLFEVTLKLIESVCVCMQDVLKKKQQSMFLIENNSLHAEDEDGGGSKINLYKKIYNKTCIHLRQELEESIKRQLNVSDSNVIRQKEFDKGIPRRHTTTINENEKQYFTLLYQSLISTQDYHTYNIHRHNLYRNKIALAGNQESSVIIIITLHPNNAKLELKKTSTINEYLLNETLHSHTVIDVDIINKSNLQKNDEILKLDNVEKCHLYSIYIFLIESKKENLIHLYKLLSVKGTIKMYIDILPDHQQANFFSKCCHNDSLLISCKNQILRRHLNEDFVTNSSEKEEMENYRNIITNIKLLVKQFNKKVNTNDLSVTDNIDDLNYTNDCHIERIYTTEQTDVTSNINTSKLYQLIYQNPIKEPTHANRVLAITAHSASPTTDIDLAINANFSIQQSNITIEPKKGYTKALSKSTTTPFNIERAVTDVTKNIASLMSSTIIIAKEDSSNSTNSSLGQVNLLKNSNNVIDTSNRRFQLKYQIPIKKTFSPIHSIFNNNTIPILSTSENVLAINNNYSKQGIHTVKKFEKGYATVVYKSITTPHLGHVRNVTKTYPNLVSTIINTVKDEKHNPTFGSSSPAIITLFKDSTNVIDFFRPTRSYKENDGHIRKTKRKENNNTFTTAINKNNYMNLFHSEKITINPVVTTLRKYIKDNTYYITNNNSKEVISNYFTENIFSMLFKSNSNEDVLLPNQKMSSAKLNTEHTTDQTLYFSKNNKKIDKNDTFESNNFMQGQNYPKMHTTWRQTPLTFETKSPVYLKNEYVYQKLSTRPTLFSMSKGSVSTKHYQSSANTTVHGVKTKPLNIMNMNSHNNKIFDKYKSNTIPLENFNSVNITPHLTSNRINNQQTIEDREISSSLIAITKKRTCVSTDLFKPLQFTQPFNDRDTIKTQNALNGIIQSPYKTTSTNHVKDKNAYEEKIGSTRPSIKSKLFSNKITKQSQNPTQKIIHTLENNEQEKKVTTVFSGETKTIGGTTNNITSKVNTMEREDNIVTSSVHLSTPSKIFNYSLRIFPTVLPLTTLRKKVYDKTHLLNSMSFNKSPKYILQKFHNISILHKKPFSTMQNETVTIPSMVFYDDLVTQKVLDKYLHTDTISTKESTVNQSESFKNTYYFMTTKLMHIISNKTNKVWYQSHTQNNNKQVTSDSLQTTPHTFIYTGLNRLKIRSSESTLEKPSGAKNVISFYDEIKQFRIFDKEKNESTTKPMSLNKTNKFSTKFLETKKVYLLMQATEPNYLDSTKTSNSIKKHKNNSNLRLPLLDQRKNNNLRNFNSKNKNMVDFKKYRRLNDETVINNIDTNFMLFDEVSNHLLPDEDYTTPIIMFKNTLNNGSTKLSLVCSNNDETVTLLPNVISKPGNFEFNERSQAFDNSLTLQNQRENNFTKINQNVSGINIDTSQKNHKGYKTGILRNTSGITINEEKNTSTTNVNQSSLTTESSFAKLETTINNPRIDARINNHNNYDFNQTIINNHKITYFPVDKNNEQYKSKEKHMPFINDAITREQKNARYDFNQSSTQNSASPYIVHTDKSLQTKKAQIGKEPIKFKNKLNNNYYRVSFPTVPLYKRTTMVEKNYSQINRSTTSNIIQRYLSTSTKGAMSVKVPLLKYNNSNLNLTQSKNIEQKTFIPHKNTNKKEIFNCSYLEIIHNVQKDKVNEEALRNKSKIFKSPIKTATAISNINMKVTSAILLNNTRNVNKNLQIYIKVTNNVQKSSDNFSRFVYTETTPSFKHLNLSPQSLMTASINNKNIQNIIPTPQKINSNRTLRKHFNINDVARNYERSLRTHMIEIPLSIENKTIIRNLQNTTQMLNSPVSKSITETNKYVNTNKYNSYNISVHSEMNKPPSNQIKRLLMHSTSSIHHVDKFEQISTILYQNTTITPEENKIIFLLSKATENSDRKSNVQQIDEVKDLQVDMHLKNKDKLKNVSMSYTDSYPFNINKYKNQNNDSATENKISLTFTNITMKDEINTTKPPTIQYAITKNKSIITSVALPYNNKRKTIEILKKTLKNSNIQNSIIQETTDNISNITEKINDGATETQSFSYKTKKTTFKAFKGNMSNNADTKKNINRINSKSTVYSEQTNPLSTSPLKNTIQLKQSSNGNRNTAKVPPIHTNLSTSSKIFKSDRLNNTYDNNVMYKLSTKSDLYSEEPLPLITSSFKNAKQLKQVINEKRITANIPLTYRMMFLTINENKNHDKILLQNYLISPKITAINETNIYNNYATKPMKTDIEKNKSNIYENEIKKINRFTTQKVIIYQKKQATIKHLKTNLNILNHQNLNLQQTSDNLIYNTNKTFDIITEIKIPSSYTTKRTTSIPFKFNMSNNANIDSVIDKFNNKNVYSKEETHSPLTLQHTTQLKQSAIDKINTIKIPQTYTKMTPTSKTFKANMSNDSEMKNLIYTFNKKYIVYSTQKTPVQTSSLKNTTQLEQTVYDKEYLHKIPLQYTKRSTTFEAFKANYNDVKNLMFKLNNESAVYAEKGHSPLTSTFNYTKKLQQNDKSIENLGKIPVTHTTITNIIKNKNQANESTLKIKKPLTNITIEDGYNISNRTATKTLKLYRDIVQNKSNIAFHDTEKNKIFNLTIQEDNATKSNIPLSHTYKFNNKSIIYSERVDSLPTTTFKYTKYFKESANIKENTLTVPLSYTITAFKKNNANTSNNIDITKLMSNFNNKNTIYFDDTPLETTVVTHNKPLMQIDNSKINNKNINITSTKSLSIKPQMEKINITSKNDSHMVTRVAQKTISFNYINNLYNKDNSGTEGLKISDTHEILQTQISTRSTLKVLKKAKTIKYNTYKPTEEDTEFKIKPLALPSNKISQRQLKLHYSLSTKPMKGYMKTNVTKVFFLKMITTKRPHIRHEIEAKNARKMSSLEENLLDPFRKTNLYPVVKKPSIKRRKIMKRLRLSNKEKDIPTINTNDIFSFRKNVRLLEKSPQPLNKDLKPNPITAIPREYIIRPKFSKIDPAIKLREEYIRPKPLFLAYDKDFYRDNYQFHHHSNALSLREKVNHIRNSLPKPPSDVQAQAVIERPAYLPTNSKPKFLRDRIYSIRNYLHNNDFVRSTQFPMTHYLEATTTTYSPYIDPLYYFRRSGWYEVAGSTQDSITIRTTKRKRRTIYFLSPTVPYYRYY